MEREQTSSQQVLDVLASAPLLEYLCIFESTLEHHPQSLHIRPTIIQAPRLKTISLDATNAEATAGILSSIRAPNCTVLKIIECAGSATGFPEPTLSHFGDFQRLALSVNDISFIRFFDHQLEWLCCSSLSCLEFTLEIPYNALTVGVEWVTNVVGSGTQELVHRMVVSLVHDGLSDGDLAAYSTFSSCHSVSKLTLAYGHALSRPILELLGNWRASGDGKGRLPAFPGLEILVLESKDWALGDLESLVSRRFGEPDDEINQEIPNLSIVIETPWYYAYDARFKLELAQVQRLRTAKGVESLTLKAAEHHPGMLAIV